MSIPTKPGTYYWRKANHCRWRLVTVRPTGEYGVENYPDPCGPLLELETWGDGGEWGPRIPSPDRLKAMEELAAEEPLAKAPPDCPWLRAQEPPHA